VNGARMPSVFQARLRFWLLTGVLTGISLAVLTVLVLTQTRWGHERVLGLTLRLAAEQLDGTLTIERLSGNLLTGAKLYGVALVGPDDDPFLLADSAYVEYSLRTIAGDEIVLDRIVLFQSEVYLRQMPGDTLWNYDRLFGDTLPPAEPVEPAEPRRPLVVRSASMVGGTVVVEMPWEPDEEASPAERRREAEAALADTSRILVREVPGGYLRTMRFTDVTADLARIVSAPDELGGTSLRLDRFTGGVQIFRDPVHVEHLEGYLSYQEALLRFQLTSIALPASRLASHGTIQFGHGEGPRLDVTVRADTLAFTDLQWLHPPLPEQGGGSLDLIIESRPQGTLYLARNLRIDAPGTRLEGSFGLIINEALYFVDVNLVADPLRVATVEQMLPLELPVVGLTIGGVEIRQAGT
jgi:hypothetical protein